MVSEKAASDVIASYMEKSEIEELSKALPVSQPPAVGAASRANPAPKRAPAEPVTLMPEVLVEHKPLQKTRCVAAATYWHIFLLRSVPGDG